MIGCVAMMKDIIMETNNRSFDDIIEDYGATCLRAKIVDTANMYPLFTEWCKGGDSISALNSLIDNINRSDTTLCAVLQSMKVHIIKGVEYGIIEDEKDR